MPKILIIQGPNMEWLGRRQPELYGTTTLAEVEAMLRAHGAGRCEMEMFTTNVEGEAITRIYRAVREGCEGLLMNPAAFLFAGYALRDCLRGVEIPYVEVHISNIEKRGLTTVLAAEAAGFVAGFGIASYRLGLDALLAVIAGRIR